MELKLIRTYHPDGTNGELWLKVCSTIELPWRGNARNVSCIPEGRYRLSWRYTERHREHLLVNDVASRDGILIHPANNARLELRGCIAPVLELTGPGMGRHSRLANARLKAMVLEAIERGETILLTIQSKDDGHS